MDYLGSLLTENLPSTKLNTKIDIDYERKQFIFHLNGTEITGMTLRQIISFINTLLIKYPGMQLPIVFNLGTVAFQDKLSYILLECLCAYLIIEKHYKVKVIMKPQAHIHTAGINSSPLMLLTTGRDDHIKRFKSSFKFEIYEKHYRRFITEANFSKNDYLSKIMDDIAIFQNRFNVNHSCREEIAEVIVELIGNAAEHGNKNCLIDFDIATPYKKPGSDHDYIGINIAIVGFSNNLLGTALRNKISSGESNGSRFEQVRKAYTNHKSFFDEYYCEEDFLNITAFQHKISGRHDRTTGGTGLTKLIQSLETRSEAHMCYVSSGKRSLTFSPEYLKYNDDNWIGFNQENDYFETKPDSSLLSPNVFVFPGTAYNLNFVLQKEDEV